MPNNSAIVLCVHHKPWLIMSTLLSVFAQDCRGKDIFILYQLGDGACPDKRTYDEYRRLARQSGINAQLSDYDSRVRDVCRIKGQKVTELEFENDQALDSGAWIKFIKTGLWKNYDYSFFIQEGNLFTRNNVMSSTLHFARANNVHFISAGHEKQKLPKSLVLRYNTRYPAPSPMQFYHDEQIRRTFEIFCRDPQFRRLYEAWGETEMITQNHVPNKGIEPLTLRIRQILRSLKRKHELAFLTRTVCENTYRRRLRNVIPDYYEFEKVIFHRANEPEWFGCSCQHLFSREFLQRLSDKLNEYDMYDVLDIPFSGSALEIIWGFLPNWLGYDKWFFDGMHRVRKNFVTYKREDNPEGMCAYFNLYFKKKVHIVPDGDFVRVDRMDPEYLYLKNILGREYFS
jgi:hypothetical protein